MLSQEDATNFFAYANKTLIKERMSRQASVNKLVCTGFHREKDGEEKIKIELISDMEFTGAESCF